MSDQESLGRDYVLHERLGQGPIAVVRRVTRRDGGPPLAATLLRPDLAGDPEVRTVFRREEATLRSLRHESIVAIEDVVFEPGQLALVTEPVGRADLRWLLADPLLADQGGTMSVTEARAVAGQIAAALAAGHAQGVTHLDLRPENVLVAPGRATRVKICNFGVVELLLDAGQDLDSIGGVTPYTAPELVGSDRSTPTPAADIYALGVILTELMTGDSRPDPAALDGVPEDLATTIRACLATDPHQRPSASALAVRLRPGDALPPPFPATSPPPFAVASPPFRPASPPFPAATSPLPVVPSQPFPVASAPAVPVPAPSPAGRRPRGPLLTLLAGLVVAAVLGTLSVSAASGDADRRNASANPAAVVLPSAPPSASAAPAAATSAPASPTATLPVVPPAAPQKFRAAYVGDVEDRGGSIAIAIRDGGAIAYFCDGRAEAWLLGTAVDGNLNLTGPRNASLTGTYGKNSAAGVVTAAGKSWALEIRRATAPSGLYKSTSRIRNAKVVAGWIVLANGDQVGLVTTDGVPNPVPRLDVSTRGATLNGVRVTAAPIDGASPNGF